MAVLRAARSYRGQRVFRCPHHWNQSESGRSPSNSAEWNVPLPAAVQNSIPAFDSRVSGSSGPPSCLSLMDRDFVALILLAGAAIFAALVVAQYYGIVHIQVLSDLSAFVHADD
jgi:hypothetical protein